MSEAQGGVAAPRREGACSPRERNGPIIIQPFTFPPSSSGPARAARAPGASDAPPRRGHDAAARSERTAHAGRAHATAARRRRGATQPVRAAAAGRRDILDREHDLRIVATIATIAIIAIIAIMLIGSIRRRSQTLEPRIILIPHLDRHHESPTQSRAVAPAATPRQRSAAATVLAAR